MKYQPDLVVVATGENEFLEDRTYESLKTRSMVRKILEDTAYSLRIVTVARNWFHRAKSVDGEARARIQSQAEPTVEVKTRLDERSGYASYHRDDAWHDRVAAQFEESLRMMAETCRQAKVPLMLIKLGSNLRDCPPYKSEHRAGLSTEDETAWQAAFDAGTSAASTDAATALVEYRKAEAIDPRYALLAFRIARVLERLGQKDRALEWYQTARDEDICPLRINTRHERILEKVATQTGTALVDAAAILAARSPEHIPGNDWYLDHVHPSIRGHQLIAQELASRIRESGLVLSSEKVPAIRRQTVYAAQLDRLGASYFAKGQTRVQWLERWARRERLYDETLPRDAGAFMRAGFRHLELGDEDLAWEEFGQALKGDKALEAELERHTQELTAEGRPVVAKKMAERLAAMRGAPETTNGQK
jgi:Tfp pilus assembly protein PilF